MTSKFWYIDSRLLHLDKRTLNCIVMVSIVWVILGGISIILITDLCAHTIIQNTDLVSKMLLIPLGICIGVFMLIFYRHIICRILFSDYSMTALIVKYGTISSLILMVTYLPSLIWRLTRDLPDTFSLFERITLNKSLLGLFLLIISLVITINLTAVFTLSLSSENHRRMIRAIYK